MRTLGRLKQDLNIQKMPNRDSLYKVKQPGLVQTEDGVLEPGGCYNFSDSWQEYSCCLFSFSIETADL